MIAPEDDGAKVGSHEIERRLLGSMRNCITKSSSLVPRSKTLKKGLFLKIFKIVKNRIFDQDLSLRPVFDDFWPGGMRVAVELILGWFGESLGSLGVSPPTQPNTIFFLKLISLRTFRRAKNHQKQA